MEISTNRELRNKSKADLRGKWGLSAAISFVAVLLIGGAAFLNGYFVHDRVMMITISIIYPLVCLVISYGLCIVFYNMLRYNTAPNIDDLFIALRQWRVFETAFLMNLFIVLWTLLLIVPGVIKGLSYAMAPYIMEDDPTCYGSAAIRRSREMMRGHKMRLFLLCLSFIGWILLSTITLCIGLIWVTPYIQTATANFYINLRDSKASAI